MRIRAVAAVTIATLVQSAGATEAERPQLKDVSVVRIAHYSVPSTVITDREQVRAIVGELARLRSKPWRRADTKLSCYATLVLLRGDRTLTLFRIKPEAVVERAPGKGQSSYSIATSEGDLPRISALLAEIPPAKDCN